MEKEMNGKGAGQATTPASGHPGQERKDDGNSGRDRMAKNVWIGWVSQAIFMVAGFVLPRMIDRSMGQEALGAWDLSWTIIAYFGLIDAGVISSVNRYIAKYKAVEDQENINISASSIGCVLLAMAGLIVGLSGVTYAVLPAMMGGKLGAYTLATQWAVFWLGMSLAVNLSFAVFGGILTGYHRWDIQYYINMGSRLATLVGMIAVLLLHGSLSTLAFIYFICEASVVSLRAVYVYKVCPALQLKARYVQWSRIKEMSHFGLKIYIPFIGEMLTNQTMNMLVVWFFGPAVLALYVRPRGLIRQVRSFLYRYSLVLVPTASSIYSRHDQEGMIDLLIEGSKNGAYILLPAIIFLAVCGDALLEIWMGSQYVQPYLFLIMLIAFLPLLMHDPLIRIISGANMHGRIGLMRILSSCIGLLLAFIIFKTTHLEILWAVAALGVPLWLGVGLYVPYFAHKNLSMPLRQYVVESVLKPILLLFPYLFCLLLMRHFVDKTVWELVAGVMVSMALLPVMYWFFVFPKSLQNKIQARIVQLYL